MAAMVIHNFEVWTGHVVSMAELESGYLKGQLCSKDYDIKQQVGLSHTQKIWRDNSQGPSSGGLTCMPTPRGVSTQALSDLLSILSVKRIDGSPSPWPPSGPHHALAGFVSPDGRSRSFTDWWVFRPYCSSF